MEKKNGAYLVAIVALAIAVVGMSIGFAFSDINLNINGDVTTKAQSWDVHFDPDNIQVTSGSVTATNAVSVQADNLTATYKVTLEKVGDFYEFTIDAKNYGDFDAKLSNIAITEGEPYLAHTVKYNGTTITNGVVDSGTTISHNDKDTYTVRVEYIRPDSEADLPTSAVTTTYSVSLTYTPVA